MSRDTDKQKESSTDEEIVELYLRREEAAIRETDRKYGRYLYRIAYNILHDRCDCEECRNDTYLGVWNAIPPARPLAFQAFITQIMRRVAINRYKVKTSKKRVPSELTVPLQDCEAGVWDDGGREDTHTAEEIGRVISEYVKGLDGRRQYVFIGRFYLAEPIGELARDLGVTVSTVYRELGRIREELKIYLERNGILL